LCNHTIPKKSTDTQLQVSLSNQKKGVEIVECDYTKIPTIEGRATIEDALVDEETEIESAQKSQKVK
jgi:hypothetical protein